MSSDSPDDGAATAPAGGARAAADALKAAVDRHLAAVEARSGENDPTVAAAFATLRAAAERYDEQLYDAHDEVTPFEFSAGPDAGGLPDPDSDEPAEQVRGIAFALGAALEVYLDALEDEDVDAADQSEELVAGAMGGLMAVVESVHGRTIVPFVPDPGDWAE